MNNLQLLSLFLLSVAINLLILVLHVVLISKDTKRRRRNLGHYLQEAGYNVLRIRWGHESKHCRVTIRENGKKKKIYLMCKHGNHFYVYDGKSDPSYLAFLNADGSTKTYGLPNKSLRSGYCLYICRQVKNSKFFSAACGVLAGGALGLFNFNTFDLLFNYLMFAPPMWIVHISGWQRAIDPSGFTDPIMLGILTGASFVIYLIPPMLAATSIYSRLRGPLVISDRPICLKCAYNLRGNRSRKCPECGQEIDTPPKDSVEAYGRRLRLMGRLVPAPPAHGYDPVYPQLDEELESAMKDWQETGDEGT